MAVLCLRYWSRSRRWGFWGRCPTLVKKITQITKKWTDGVRARAGAGQKVRAAGSRARAQPEPIPSSGMWMWGLWLFVYQLLRKTSIGFRCLIKAAQYFYQRQKQTGMPGHAGGQGYDPTPPASGSHCSNVRTLCSRPPPSLQNSRGPWPAMPTGL